MDAPSGNRSTHPKVQINARTLETSTKSMGAPERGGVADGGAERAHPRRLLRDLAFGVHGVGIMGLQGYLARKKLPTPIGSP